MIDFYTINTICFVILLSTILHLLIVKRKNKDQFSKILQQYITSTIIHEKIIENRDKKIEIKNKLIYKLEKDLKEIVNEDAGLYKKYQKQKKQMQRLYNRITYYKNRYCNKK